MGRTTCAWTRIGIAPGQCCAHSSRRRMQTQAQTQMWHKGTLLPSADRQERIPPFDSVMSEVREHKAKTALPAVQSGIGEIGGSEFALLHTTPCPHKSTSTQIDGAARCAPVETLTDPLESQASASQCHERHRAEPISPAVR